MNYNHSDRVTEFKNSIRAVTDMLSHSRYAPYLEFSIGDFKISTHKNNNYFMQMNITYTGAGSANTTGIELAYIPKPGEDPNFIDKALDGAVASKKSCYLRFGYSGSPVLFSQLYECILLDYKVSLRDHMIYYSISCISTIAKYRELRSNFPIGRELYDAFLHTNDNGESYYTFNTNPIHHIKTTIEKFFKDKEEKWSVAYEDPNLESYVEPMKLRPIDDVTVFQYVESILNKIEDKSTQQAIYWYSLTDTPDADGYKYVILHRSINDIGLIDEVSKDTLFTFDWGGNPQDKSKNTLVIAFENSFTGAVNIATLESVFQDRYAINSSGDSIKVNGPEHTEVGDFASEEMIESGRFWWKSSAWVYDAQLEIHGIPADIPLATLIRVRPLIYGREHHTGGIYMITGATSNINSGGFTTSLKLVKYIDSNSMVIAKRVAKIRADAEEKQRLWSQANPSPRYSTYNDYVSRNNTVNIQSVEVTTTEAPSTSESDTFIPDPNAQNKKAKEQYEYTQEMVGAVTSRQSAHQQKQFEWDLGTNETSNADPYR